MLTVLFFQVPFIVYELNAFAQNKALDGALKQVKAICPNVPTMFISADQEAGKVLCMAQVSKEVSTHHSLHIVTYIPTITTDIRALVVRTCKILFRC